MLDAARETVASFFRERPSWLQIANAATFVLCVIGNALSSSSAMNKIGGETNGQVSNAHKTAFTPAGYAFSIWGIIYTLVSMFCVFQLHPARRQWVSEVVGWRFIVVNLANASWLLCFGFEVGGGQWLSSVVLFTGLLAPLVWLHRRMRVGDPTQSVAPAELICAHGMVSIYSGWCCVAAIANVAIALTPRNAAQAPGLGWTAAGWSVLMQVVATVLAGTFLALYKDWVFASPITWALFAIGVQQRSPAYPGGSVASNAGFALGGILLAATVSTALWRAWLWRLDQGKGGALATDHAGAAAGVGDSYLAIDRQGLIVAAKV